MLKSAWQKSTKTDSGNCVEARLDEELIEVRNSNDPDGQANPKRGSVFFTQDEWRAFIGGIKLDEFDID